MYLIDMLLAEALEHDPEDNRNLHTWIVVSLFYQKLSLRLIRAVPVKYTMWGGGGGGWKSVISRCTFPDVPD